MFRKERARTYSWGKDVVQSMDNKKCIRCFEVHVLIYLEVKKQLGNSPGSSNCSNFGVRITESKEAEGLFGENNFR
jgi:hypothetical protein